MPKHKAKKTKAKPKVKLPIKIEATKPERAIAPSSRLKRAGRRRPGSRASDSGVYLLNTADEPNTSEAQVAPLKRVITVMSITTSVADLVKQPFNAENLPFDILSIYRDMPKTTLAKLRNGVTNPARDTGGVLLKKILYFQPCALTQDPATVADKLVQEKITENNDPRFVLVTNGEYVHIRDRKTGDTCNRLWNEDEHWGHFLLPLNPKFGRMVEHKEHLADVNAASKLRRLYEAILKASPEWADGNHTHELNVLMTRILFCLYAEDTGIFDTKKIFTDTVRKYSDADGSDLSELLTRLFVVMNIEKSKRPAKISPIEASFPYVNGNLFERSLPIPRFDGLARRSLLECGEELNWTKINPDIFGSMIQTISDPTSRASIGMHYTSVPNIMKVLRPLFLDELDREFTNAKSVGKLETLRTRLANIRIFDPACGSGNFLIIAYKELRKLEMRVFARISELAPNEPLRISAISLDNFYGVDIIDFACETARLSLWIAEHQMNVDFLKEFGSAKPTLPLARITTIQRDNALSLNWDTICSQSKATETYICGNPPYSGRGKKTDEQKMDLAYVLAKYPGTFKKIDYISGWFIKAAEQARTTGAHFAFVSTNSIAQGEHIALLWPLLLNMRLEITFAYPSFKWSNSASHNAGITCVIVGIGPADQSKTKTLFSDGHEKIVNSITPYLTPGRTTIVSSAPNPAPPDRPTMDFGNMPRDGGHLILTDNDKQMLLKQYPDASRLIRQYVGSDEFVNHVERYCLWIEDEDAKFAYSIPPIAKRLELVRQMRLQSPAQSTQAAAKTSYRFVQIQRSGFRALIMPAVTSERRLWLQVGVVDAKTIVSNLAFAVYDPPAHLLALLSSKIHALWARAVGGNLETRIRYSNTLVYNTFPIPALSDEQKRVLSEHSRAILKARAKHPGQTIAALYNPETMPLNLLEAHQENDRYIEEHIYGRRFNNDEERLEHLFEMYARTNDPRNHEDTLFSKSARKKPE